MAKAYNLADSVRTRTLKYKHSSAVAKDDVILLGGRVLVATGAFGANEEGVYIFAVSMLEVTTAASQAWTAGATIYWDNTNAVFTTVSTSNTKCGIAYEDKASTTTTGVMVLDNTVNF